MHDLRCALRQFRGSPLITVVVLSMLALGAGVTSAVFIIADPMLFRPLPYPDSGRVVTVVAPEHDRFDGSLQVPDAFAAATHSGFEAVGGYYTVQVGRIEGVEGEAGWVRGVTQDLLEKVLRVQPAIGRTFARGEYATADASVALLTYPTWQAVCGGCKDIVGRTIAVRASTTAHYRVVGVLPRTFVFPDQTKPQPALLVPGRYDPTEASDPRSRCYVLARLKRDVSIASAASEMRTLATRVEHDFPQFPQKRAILVLPLRAALFGETVQRGMLLLLGITGGLLLVAAVNVAHLISAHYRKRAREFAIRRAVGGSPWRLARQFATEQLVLGVVGTALAAGVGRSAAAALVSRAPKYVYYYRMFEVQLGLRAIVWTALLVLGALLVCALGPIVRACRGAGSGSTLAQMSPQAGRRRRSDAVLVMLQVAVTVGIVLASLVAAGAYSKFAWQPRGLTFDGLIAVRPDMPRELMRKGDRSRLMTMRRDMYERLRNSIGVPVAVADGTPASTSSGTVRRPDMEARARVVDAWGVSGSYLRLVRANLVRGRLFDDREAFQDAPVAVLDQRAAELLFGTQNPLGQVVVGSDARPRRVVGVVQTVRKDLAGTRFQTGGAFLPFDAHSLDTLLVCQAPFTHALAERIRTVVHAVEPRAEVTIEPLQPYEYQLSEPRFVSLLLVGLGITAAILALVGIYGVMSDQTTARLRDIGIRMCLGATPARIHRSVLARAMVPTLVGATLGLSIALWWADSIGSLLVKARATPYQASTYLLAAAVVVAVAALAAWLPSRRASRADLSTLARAE